MRFEIEAFDPKSASDQLYAAYNKCSNMMRAERVPDDLPIPLEETIQGFRNIPNFIGVVPWVVWNGEASELVAYGGITYSHQDNLHMAQFSISVLPESRRQGIGRAILSNISEIAAKENRSLLITNTVARIPAGEAFMERLGAKRGLEAHTNQLAIADLDPNLIHQWIEKGSEKGKDFEIRLWEGVYPENHIDEIVELHDLLNQQPLGDLEVEDFSFSADHVRQMEKSVFARGYKRWTLFAKEKQSGSFAGYTEVIWNPARPELVDQGITGVFPQFRNKGLGRLLKAKMLERVLSERPEVKFVRTQNADMNAPMMKINVELGFKPYNSESIWQVSADTVVAFLEP